MTRASFMSAPHAGQGGGRGSWPIGALFLLLANVRGGKELPEPVIFGSRREPWRAPCAVEAYRLRRPARGPREHGGKSRHPNSNLWRAHLEPDGRGCSRSADACGSSATAHQHATWPVDRQRRGHDKITA